MPIKPAMPFIVHIASLAWTMDRDGLDMDASGYIDVTWASLRPKGVYH